MSLGELALGGVARYAFTKIDRKSIRIKYSFDLLAFWTIDDFGIPFCSPLLLSEKTKTYYFGGYTFAIPFFFSRTFIANNHLADRFR